MIAKNKIETISDFLVNRRHICAILLTVFAVILLPGVQWLSFDSNYKVFVNKENRFLQELNYIEDVYQSGEDSMIFLIKAGEGKSMFRPQGLQLIREVTNKATNLPFAFDTVSLANYQYIHANGDLLTVVDLIPVGTQITQETAKKVEAVARGRGSEVLMRRFISDSGKLAAIAVIFSLKGDRTKAVLAIRQKAETIRDRLVASHPETTILLGGLLMYDYAMIQASLLDAIYILPFVGLIIFCILSFVFRSVISASYIIGTVILNVIMTYCFVGWFGSSINTLTFSGMIAIATLSVADSIHLLTGFLTNIRENMDKCTAMREALRVNFIPMFLTSFTTLIGFGCLYFSPSPPVQQLGLFTGVGLVFDFLTTIFLLPTLLLFLNNHRGIWEKVLIFPKLVTKAALQRPRLNLILGVVIYSVIGVFTFHNTLDDDSLKWFSKRMEFRQSVDISVQELEGFKSVTFNVNAGSENGVLTLNFMKRIDAFRQWLAKQPEVLTIRSYLDVVKETRQIAHEDNPDFYGLPQSKQEAAQLLLMRELSVPSSRSLNNMISIDKREVRVIVSVKNIPNTQYLDFERRASGWLKGQSSPLVSQDIQGTSVPLMFAQISQDNLKGVILGSSIAVIMISICLAIAFQSIRYGLISLLPNIMPILFIYGIWGILYGTLNMAAVTTFSIALGIIVDDTVHIISKYLMARRDNQNPHAAVQYTLYHGANAVTLTTIVLICGFMMLSFSHFQLSATQGWIVAMVIASALILDLLFLPALLIILDKKMIQKKSITTIIVLVLGCGVFFANEAYAQSPSQKKGLAIIEAANKKHAGYQTLTAKGIMTLYDARGRRSVRIFDAAVGEGNRSANRTLMDFKNPKDVEGTKLLTHGTKVGNDKQWLYLPTLKKVKRIAGSNQKNSFMGSEFSYEDLTTSAIDKYEYEWLKTLPCPNGNGSCDLVQKVAKNKTSSAYLRSVVWIEKKRLLVRQIDNYARNNELIKRFRVKSFILVDGKFWRVETSTMENVISDRKTDMNWSQYRSQGKLPFGIFDSRRLGR